MSLTYGLVLKRALLVGLIVGVVLGTYVLVVVETVVTEAIDLEERLAEAAAGATDVAEDDEDPLVTRRGQLGGAFASSVLLSLIVASIFGTIFAAARHRLPGRTDFHRSVWLAAAGFLAVAFIPGIKYPATPPAVGDGNTVGERGVQWLSIVLVSLILVFALCQLSAFLRTRYDDATRMCLVGGASITAYALLVTVYPSSPDSISPDVPAALVWDFRIRSLGSLALLWTGVGGGVGYLMTQLTRRVDSLVDTCEPAAATAGAI